MAGAKTAGIERFSVIGIDDGGNTAQLRSYYGPHVYGGGAMTIARNTVEFASLIAGSCFGDAVTLRALEVNQGAQDWHNSKTLLEFRETVVRAFVETPAGAPDQRVTGRLTGRRDGVELPGSPLVATNGSGNVLARNGIVARRGQIDDSLNFELPLSWTSGGVELEFDAGGAPVDCKEPSDPGTGADDCLVSPPFDAPTTLGVSFFGVEIDGTGPSWDDIAEQTARVQSALPVSALNTSWRTLDYTSRPSIDDLNDDLHRMREVERTSCTGGCATFARDVYYGLLDGPAVGGLNGKANGIPGDAASSFTNNLTQPTSSGYARNTVVHELSHTLGVHHAVDNDLGISGGFLWWGGNKTGHCGEVASKDAPGHTPFISVDGNTRPGLGPISPDDDEVWGLDHRFARADENELGLSDPEEVWALMGYCSDGDGQFRWSSAFERDQQIAGIRARGRRRWRRRRWQLGDRRDRLPGRRRRAAGREPRRADQRHDQREGQDGFDRVGAAAALRGRRRAGRRDVHAARRGRRGRPARGASFHAVGAFRRRRGRRSLRFVRRGGRDSRGRRDRQGRCHQPQRRPACHAYRRDRPGTDRERRRDLRRQHRAGARHPDLEAVGRIDIGDLLLARRRRVVAPAGVPRRWRVVRDQPRDAGRHGGGPLRGHDHRRAARGGRAAHRRHRERVQRRADDRDHVAARIDPSPSGLQPIVFAAIAGDRDQELDDEAVVWSSDRDGVLGSGASLTRGADTLSEGKHTITATVTDDEGATATDTVEIEVFRVPPPPPSADKTVTASAPAEVIGGDETTVTVKVSNAGPSRSRALRLTATLPVGTAAGVPDDGQGWTARRRGAT